MSTLRARGQLVVDALALGMAVPFFYFGIQIVAAFFYPGYSFMSRDASTLGSNGSRFPAMFNVGAIILGIVTFLSAWGFMQAFRHLRVNPILAWLTVLAVVSFGLGSINAGVFPLPDPRHSESALAVLGIGVILLPFVIPAALCKLRLSRQMKVYFLLNILFLLALIPVISGLVQRIIIKFGTESPSFQSFLNNYQGLLQRIFAVIAICPIGVGAYVLANRTRGLTGNSVTL